MNLRPSGYEPDELPDCSTPHLRDADYREASAPTQPLMQSVVPKSVVTGSRGHLSKRAGPAFPGANGQYGADERT